MNNKFNTIVIDPGHGGVDVGFSDGIHYEKDFNLDIAMNVYNRLKELGYPVYLTRDGDYTISNYDRFEFLDKLTKDNNGNTLVFSIQVDDENPSDISIIRSINRDYNANKELYDQLRELGEVKVKTLPSDNEKDFYAIQRLTPEGSESIIIEFGYNELNDLQIEKERLGEIISNIIIDYSNNINLNNLYDNYIVQKGEYLYMLSKRFNTTVEELKRVNGLGTDNLAIGQVLLVPKMNNNIYIVKKGDSLYSIAKKFNTEVDKIKDINNLISNKLIVNQKLLIPN